MIHSKQHRGCRIQDPGTRGYRGWKTADFSHSARAPRTVLPLRVVDSCSGVERGCWRLTRAVEG